MRQRTLPIIKSKETALRLEVKKCKEEADELERKLQSQIEGYSVEFYLIPEQLLYALTLHMLEQGHTTDDNIGRFFLHLRPLGNMSAFLGHGSLH